MMDIRPVTTHDLAHYVAHVERQLSESGAVRFPVEAHRIPKRDALLAPRRDGLARPITEPGWRRMWAAWLGDKAIAGLELVADQIPAGMHRAAVLIGIEAAYWNSDAGQRLFEVAHRWLADDTHIAWLDAGVFARDSASLALYRRLGFAENQRVVDRYRVANDRIEVVGMCRRVGPR